jgi:hypothetical protein
MNGSGREGNNNNNNRRRSFRRRDRDDNWSRDDREGKKRDNQPRYDKQKGTIIDRPKWSPPKVAHEPLPQLECVSCGKPIKDISLAIAEKSSGNPLHFDCVIAQITKSEKMERGDVVTYIGGGRFGVVHFDSPHDHRKFKIKKIFEYEEKDARAAWRSILTDRYSTT